MKSKQTKAKAIRRREILNTISADFEISRGTPQPFGASFVRGGINFAVYAPHAKFISLVLFTKCHTDILLEFPLDPDFNRTGHVWHAMVRGLDSDIRYGFRVVCDQPLAECDKEIVLLDPYSRSTCGSEAWGAPLTIKRKNRKHTFRLSQVVENKFDWEQDKTPHIPLKDSVIYELHVRGFTRHPSSGVKAAGTFAGLIEKIPYLKDLGVTAVELMPVTDFDETYPGNTDPKTGKPLLNLWGYDPISFFAPKAAFAQNSSGSGPLDEFRRMVKAFHQAGMEIILDMVFNHTGEENPHPAEAYGSPGTTALAYSRDSGGVTIARAVVSLSPKSYAKVYGGEFLRDLLEEAGFVKEGIVSAQLNCVKTHNNQRYKK